VARLTGLLDVGQVLMGLNAEFLVQKQKHQYSNNSLFLLVIYSYS